MTVRRLRSKQRGPWCSYCHTRATFRGCGFTRFACAAHLPDLEKEDANESTTHMSEADYQTWGRYA